MKQLEFPEKDKFYTLISITNKDNTAIHPFFQSLIGKRFVKGVFSTIYHPISKSQINMPKYRSILHRSQT